METGLKQQVIRLIEKYDLTKEDRHRDFLYPRYYLYWVCVEKLKMTLQATGQLFGKDHSSVIHGIKTHDMFTEADDSIYEYYIRHVRSELELPEMVVNLTDDVLKCKSYHQLKLLKKRIKEGYYISD